MSDVDLVLDAYPKIYFFCHRRHVRDEQTSALLSTHQASILDHLDDLAPTNLAGLARHMDVTPSTMSLAIDRLERAGYVTRARSPHDRRRVDLLLTPAGLRIKRQQKVLDPDLVAQMLGRLGDRRRRQALRGLQLLAEACAKPPKESPR
jgi:DNA-binding MarR family transcriptional regulator